MDIFTPKQGYQYHIIASKQDYHTVILAIFQDYRNVFILRDIKSVKNGVHICADIICSCITI